MNLRAKGNVQLDVLEAFNPDLFASGAVALDAAVTGTAAQPSVNGRLELRSASLNMITAPNGIANANGSIEFTGREAVIQNITGQSGGGKIGLSGIVAYGGGGGMRVRLQATADNVRVNYPETVSTAVDAKLSLLGTTARSVLSGDVTIQEVALYQQSDIGSMLSSAAAPPSSPTPRTGFLGGVRFDVRVRTASDVRFRTALTQNLAADADLNLRGTLDDPGMLGAINITRGELIFFGSRYDIERGNIRFNNPREINPNIDIDLSTRAQGIDVGINVSGPMRRLKLTYHSDPPMLFSDLVSLLASGRAPTTDPVLAARQPTAPQQSFQQAGASALLGQAANPVTGRLQRLFGVSRLKIDPQITGASNTPQATLTLQQQITRDLTFTYIQDVTQSNPQAVRIEWAINPRWSALAQRDLNGMFNVDLFYRTRFR
jgi:translocation and assembly module TamB